MLWQGIQTFANTYGYTADAQTAAGNTADEAEAALRAAAESGASSWSARRHHGRGALPHAGKLP